MKGKERKGRKGKERKRIMERRLMTVDVSDYLIFFSNNQEVDPHASWACDEVRASHLP